MADNNGHQRSRRQKTRKDRHRRSRQLADGPLKRFVTYEDFAKLARRLAWTAAWLAERFKGKIEQPREFFERVLKTGPGSENRGATAIPYRSVVDFYQRELAQGTAADGRRTCKCGCRKPVFGRKQVAGAACQKRIERRRSLTRESGSKKVNKDGPFSATFPGGR